MTKEREKEDRKKEREVEVEEKEGIGVGGKESMTAFYLSSIRSRLNRKSRAHSAGKRYTQKSNPPFSLSLPSSFRIKMSVLQIARILTVHETN